LLPAKVAVVGMPGGWNFAGMTGGKEQYWAYRRDSVRFRMPSGLDGFANRFLFLVE
jgi:hypothetical protein